MTARRRINRGIGIAWLWSGAATSGRGPASESGLRSANTPAPPLAADDERADRLHGGAGQPSANNGERYQVAAFGGVEALSDAGPPVEYARSPAGGVLASTTKSALNLAVRLSCSWRAGSVVRTRCQILSYCSAASHREPPVEGEHCLVVENGRDVT